MHCFTAAVKQYNSVVARKMLLVQSNFHHANIHCWSPDMFHKQWWMSMGEFFFLMEKFNDTYLFHTPFQSNAILSDCTSAATCYTATKNNGILVGRLSFYCRTVSICLLHCGPTWLSRRITSGAALMTFIKIPQYLYK